MRPNLAVLRSAIGPMLTEAGVIERESGTAENPETGMLEPVYITAFSGPVLVRPEGGVKYVDVGAIARPIRSFDITFPAGADVIIGDVLTLDSCPFDPDLVGKPIKVTDVQHDSWQVAAFCIGKLDSTA